MMNIDKKKAFTLFALTLLVTSLLLVGINLPSSALPQDDLIYLDGPSLTPIHMDGPSLTPIHMHSLMGIIDLYTPMGTPWHEIYPDYCESWTFTSWEDNGNGYLDPSDQIDMTNDVTQEVRWFHVDRVTMTLGLWSEDYQEFIYVEFKGPYDPDIFPISTLWHEVWPVYNGVTGHPYHIIDWIDNGSGHLDFCDYIMFEDWMGIWWHVEEYATDLILNEKVMDPIGIEWHELYPSFGNYHLLTSWEEPIDDPFPGRLSPGDQIDMLNETTQETKWYYVDRVTFTMRISNLSDPRQEWYIEYKGPFETMYNIKTTVVNSTWHEVYPLYSPSLNITDWEDNCNGVLDYCDNLELHDLYADLYYGWWHVEELSIDIILNEKIDDPTGIIWHELYPECSVNDYETLDWEDNGDGLLNPCDNVTLALLPTGLTDKYHVENMTLTLNLTVEDVVGHMPFTPGERIYIEYLSAIYYGWEWMYYPKTHPLYTDWEVVCPTDLFGYPLTIENWYDNCNGVLSYGDMLELLSPDGGLWVTVDEVAVDITVKKITEEPPPPPPWHKKASYPDYAPSGMPDFDQKQDSWGPGLGLFTWCGPVSVANSLWWLDSEYESIYNPSPVPPPAISDSFPLVESYNPGVWDDHDPRNVDPLVHELAFLMDADGQRTGLTHIGTNYIDMETGLSQYLQWHNVNPMGDCDGDGDVDDDDLIIIDNAMFSIPGDPNWDMRADITVDNFVDFIDWDMAIHNYGQVGLFYEHTEEFPDFLWIEDEIYACEDVVLFLEFWQEIGPGEWIPLYDNPSLEAGHYVTSAGVNSSTYELLISDPYWDAAEAGFWGHIPVPHPAQHPPDVHNDTQYVSHDAYPVASWMGPPPSPYPGMPIWELLGYLQQLGYDPSWHAFIRAAVVTSPLAQHDVAVINVTTSKTGCLPLETVGQGNNVTIYVTAENQGGFTETFNVTAYANTTVIGTLSVTLNSGDTQTLTFTWDTTGFAYGNYTISATADTVPGEIDMADNTMVDGTILVTLPGDIDGDRDVDIYDIVRMAGIYGISQPDPQYDPNCDLDDDGDIDIYDIVAAAGNYGKSW